MVCFCVSAGVDSIAACHWLIHRYHIRSMVNFQIVHFNHGLRPQNDEMQQKVESFAKEFNLFLDVFKLHADTTDERHLRDLRLSRMKEYAVTRSFADKPWFMTAHHLNDAVENYINNTISGNPEYMPISLASSFDEFNIIHPFLKTSKRELIEYAEENDLMRFVVEDDTNEDNKYKRNHIRNVVIPELNKWTNLETIVRKKFYEHKDASTIE